MPSIVEILIATSPTAPMESRDEARAVPGLGLAGDRYFLGIGIFSPSQRKPDHELTLIESEVISIFSSESGLPFTAAHARRNIVTTGIRLNDLVGREFTLGEVRIKGHRLCEHATISQRRPILTYCVASLIEAACVHKF